MPFMNRTPSIRFLRTTCVECGSTEIHPIERNGVQRLGIAHEDDCAFLEAVQREQAEAWVSRNGYPIRYEQLDAKGAA